MRERDGGRKATAVRCEEPQGWSSRGMRALVRRRKRAAGKKEAAENAAPAGIPSCLLVGSRSIARL